MTFYYDNNKVYVCKKDDVKNAVISGYQELRNPVNVLIVKDKLNMPKLPNKERARRILRYAVQKGEIERQPCEDCGKEKTHGHHVDYSKPLEVKWLCITHHFQWHRENHSKNAKTMFKANTLKNKLTKKQVFAIPKLLEKRSIGEVAKAYNVSWNAIWYWIQKLRVSGIEIKTRKRGSVSKIIKRSKEIKN